MEIVNLNENNFEIAKRNFIKFKKDFEVQKTSFGEAIIIDDKKYKRIKNTSRIDGAHLIKLFNKSVQKKLDSGFIPPTGLSMPLQDYFQLDNIEANLEEICTVIDLKSAYWTAAWKLGYINSIDYYSTWHQAEWKDGKTAAIGALNKTVYIDTYKNGLLIQSGTPIYQEPIKQDVRLHIINYVTDTMKRLANIAGSNFLSIQTDAITIVPKSLTLAKVFKEIADSGFKYKLSKIVFHEVQNYKIIVSHFPNDELLNINYNEKNIFTK